MSSAPPKQPVRNEYRSVPYSELESFGLRIIGSQDSKIYSQVRIHHPDVSKDHAPLVGGICDLRMGTTDREHPCGSCHLKYKQDPGHFGDLELRAPCISVLFRLELARWLKIICFKCGGPIINLEGLKLPEQMIIREYAKQAQTGNKNRLCSNIVRYDANGKPVTCDTPHPKVQRDKNSEVRFTTEMYSGDPFVPNKVDKLWPHQMAEILGRVTDETCRKLGRPYHPRKLIVTNIPIPPNQIRPESKVHGSTKSKNNDLTQLIHDLARDNQAIPENIVWTYNTPIDRDLGIKIERLNFRLHAYIKGSSAGANKSQVVGSGNRTLVGVAKRIPGKYGRIRRHIMGRRVRVTSRSFITCDNTLRLTQVGFPRSECKIIQRKEPVRAYNHKQMLQYFENGKVGEYPGASAIWKASKGGHRFDIGPDKNLTLEIGDVISRDIVDGDTIGFNRQPSLEPSSMTAQKARIMSHSTFRINLQIVDFYNADFDGDAMMCVFPNSSRTQNEIEMLAGPNQFFISYKEAQPKVGNAHDSLIGLATMTRSGTRIDKYHAMSFMSNTPVYNDFSQDEIGHEYTGRDLVSMLLRGTGNYINYRGTPAFYIEGYKLWIPYNPEDIKIEIKRGKVETGILDGACLGGKIGSLYHIIHNQYGAQAALDASYNMQQLALNFIGSHGFTIDLQNILLSTEAMDSIHTIISSMVAASLNTTDKLNRGKILAPRGTTVAEHYEHMVTQEDLAPKDRLWAPLVGDMDVLNNGLMLDILHGVKGKMFNIKATNSAIGCLEVNGQRFPEVFDRRCLAHKHRYDPHPGARGFIANGYNQGLEPTEFLFHAMEARYQIVARALNTSKTGHQNRMAVKNLEGHIVDNMRRLSTSHKVTQLVYGGDGADPRYIEPVVIPTMKAELTHAEMEAKFRATPAMFGTVKVSAAKAGKKVGEKTKKGGRDTDSDSDRGSDDGSNNSEILGGAAKQEKPAPGMGLAKALEEEFQRLVEDRTWYQDVHMRLEMSSGLSYREKVNSPVPVGRLIDNIVSNLHLDETKTDLPRFDPIGTVEKVKDFCERLPYCLLNSIQERKRSAIPEHLTSAVKMLQVLIRSYVNCRTLMNHGFTDDALELLLENIRTTYVSSLISYGMAMGIIAAQSLSEPATQMVLDSHQTSGGAGSTKKKGLVRYTELLAAKDTDKLKSGASMTLHVLERFRNNKAKVREIAGLIEMLSLRQFYRSWKIFYEQFGEPVHPKHKHEKAMIQEFLKYHPANKPPGDLANWCILISLDKNILIEKQMRMDQIYQTIRSNHPGTYVVYTNDNDRSPQLRIYVRTSMFDKGITLQNMKDLTNEILNLTVRGVEGIQGASVNDEPVKMHVRADDGSLKAEDIYYITTMGTNLEAILELPYFDHRYTQSDSIQEMYKVFGIASANTKIVQELKSVISSVNDKITHRHYTVYADEMTSSGLVTSIDRYGSAKRDAPILLRISDSSPVDVIMESALSHAKDRLSGVSPPIMLGKNPRVGDLYNSFVLNEAFIRELFGGQNNLSALLSL